MLTDVRVAEAEGFDRIVLEFSGTGTPGWVVDYVDKALIDGSGEAVALSGNAILDIYASGTTWPARDYYSGPSQFTPANGGDVGGTFSRAPHRCSPASTATPLPSESSRSPHPRAS